MHILEKKERSKISHPNFHLWKPKKEQIKSKISRRKEIIKIRAEINEIENRKSRKNQQNQKLVL